MYTSKRERREKRERPSTASSEIVKKSIKIRTPKGDKKTNKINN